MLKKMRIRMILAAMIAFFAVILMTGVLVNVVNYAVVTKNADRTLDVILNFENGTMDRPMGPDAPGPLKPKEPQPPEGSGGKPMEPFMALPDIESNYMTRFFTVKFDAEGKVLFASTDYIAAVDETKAVEFAGEVLAKRGDRGYLKEYRYLKGQSQDDTIVIFLNASREQRSVRELLVMTMIISAVSLIVVFILVVLLSGRAIGPFANNIKLQKQFITDASHELKTPLTSISTSIDVITLEKGYDEWTENIRKQTGRMSKLVNELVILSRLDEETPFPDKEHFSLTDTAWEVMDVYKQQAKGAGKDLSIDIAEDVKMYGDRSSIRQMLSVLMDNAIRYSDENGQIRFTVSKKRNRINIEVFNTCDYEEPPDTDRLFDRFYRPDSSRNEKTGGTGIGLSIAKAVAEGHGGKIKAICPSGKTMTIKISI